MGHLTECCANKALGLCAPTTPNMVFFPCSYLMERFLAITVVCVMKVAQKVVRRQI